MKVNSVKNAETKVLVSDFVARKKIIKPVPAIINEPKHFRKKFNAFDYFYYEYKFSS